jgi:hypothetical protein
MLNTIAIPLNVLRATLTHTAVKDIRYYLNGVFIDTARGKVVATDGHRMIVVDAETVRHAVIPSFIIPDDSIRAMMSAYKGTTWATSCAPVDITVTLADVPSGGVRVNTGTLAAPTGTVNFNAIDGKYPDYSRVIPAPDQVGAYAFSILNPDYVVDAIAAVKILAGIPAKKSAAIPVWTQGDRPALVYGRDSGPKALIIIMPMRDDSGAAGIIAADRALDSTRAACRAAQPEAAAPTVAEAA